MARRAGLEIDCALHFDRAPWRRSLRGHGWSLAGAAAIALHRNQVSAPDSSHRRGKRATQRPSGAGASFQSLLSPNLTRDPDEFRPHRTHPRRTNAVSLFVLYNTPPLASRANLLGHSLALVAHVAFIAGAGVIANRRLFGLLTTLCPSRAIASRVLFGWLAGNYSSGVSLPGCCGPSSAAPH